MMILFHSSRNISARNLNYITAPDEKFLHSNETKKKFIHGLCIQVRESFNEKFLTS